jgi:putative heme iron utilization protein
MRNDGKRALREELLSFLASSKSLVLATVGEDGSPGVSYAPFVRDERNSFYIYVSELARHTGNLAQTGRASIMVIEDEAAAAELFARRRATFECDVVLVPRDSADWQQRLEQLRDACGELVEVLRTLRDFRLYCLRPRSGVYVKGFGKAYRISGEDLTVIQHVGRSDRSDKP